MTATKGCCKQNDDDGKSTSRAWILYLLIFIGLCIFGLGVASMFTLDSYIRSQIADGLVLRPGSDTVKQWSDPPADSFMEIYLLNVTNPKEAAAGLAKPKIVDQGPYVFRQLRRKANLTFHRNKTVSFTEPIYYFFEREKSIGPLSDKITTLDLVVAGTSHKFAQCYTDSECFVRTMVKNVLPTLGFDLADDFFRVQKRSIFKTYTVNELLWGHEDPFLKKMAEFAQYTGQNVEQTSVGLFEGKNGSANGVYTIFSGEGNMTAYQQIVAFNGMTKQTAWTTPYANMMNGTIGHGFRPFLTPKDNIEIFAPDLCRSSELAFERTTVIRGLEMFVYRPPNWKNVGWPRKTEKDGFCTPDCPPEGIMNETACIGQPILMAKPHFLHCDPRMLESFDGFHPDESQHETFLYVEPITGSVLAAKSHLMFLFPFRESFISKAGNIRLTPNMPDGTVAFPLFWVNVTAMAHESVFDQIRTMAVPAMMFAHYGPLIFVVIGISITVISIIILLWCTFRRQCRGGSKSNENSPTKSQTAPLLTSPDQEQRIPAENPRA